jgi:hypothetical protein
MLLTASSLSKPLMICSNRLVKKPFRPQEGCFVMYMHVNCTALLRLLRPPLGWGLL